MIDLANDKHKCSQKQVAKRAGFRAWESSPIRNVGLQSVSRRCLYWLYEDVVAELLGEQVAYLLHVLELFHQLLQLVHVACHFHHLRL